VRTVKATLVLGAVFLCSPLVAASLSMDPHPREVPSFFRGERLVYDISWSGIIVGEGVLQSETGEPLNGRDVFRISSTARSNRVLSYLFPVKDRIESIVDAKAALVLRLPDHTLDKTVHPASSFALSEKERSVAAWAFSRHVPAGRFTDTLPESEALHLPLQARTAVMGKGGLS